jgi:hypothetical protein
LNLCARAIAASTFALLFFAASISASQAQQSSSQGETEQKEASQAASDSDSEQTATPRSQASQPTVESANGTNDPSPENNSINPNPAGSKEPPKRMFGMIPDFESANDTPANQKPLTVHQKYMLSLHQAFDFSSHIGDAFQAGIQQATNSQPHFGHGGGAYGERFAAAEADQTSGSILIYGFFPSVLHEDPRYFRMGKGSARSRLWYAINRTFVTRRDDGSNGFNRSETFGQLVSCGISTSYYPAQDRSAAGVFLNWAVNLGYNSGYNILTEYYTDLLNNIFHRHRAAAGESTELQPTI